MRRILVSILLFTATFSQQATAQSLAINTDGSTADGSALLDVKSTLKGMLIPRMNKTERYAIAAPATGLLVFQNAPDSIGFYYYTGSAWLQVANSSNGWSTTGNAGTSPAGNFLGTTDNNALAVKTNNVEQMRLTTNGELALGTTAPNSTYGYAKMEIASEGIGTPTDLLIRNAATSAGYAPGLVFQHARGTLATPTTVNNGDYLSAISTMNYDGANYILSAGLDIYADGAIAAGIVPTRLQFNTMNTTGGYASRLTIKNDGKVGIGTNSPATLTHISGGNFLVNGIFGSSPSLEISGGGTKMFFYPRKAAVRAGAVSATQWDDANIGNYSVGFGANAQAITDYSVSIGEGNVASTAPFAVAIGRQNSSTGFASLAMGHFSQASGDYSSSIGLRDTVSGFGASSMGSYNKVSSAYGFAGGYSNIVTGDAGIALGNTNNVSATGAIAMGNNNYAPSYGETTIGNFATQYSALSPGGVNTADRVFTIGNGTGTSSRSDAMVVLKSGRTGIAVPVPAATLDVGGDFKLGANGVISNALLRAMVNIDVPAIAANSEVDITATLTNASITGSAVFISPVADIEPGVVIAWARVSAANTIKIRFKNTTGAPIDPVAVNYVISVLQ